MVSSRISDPLGWTLTLPLGALSRAARAVCRPPRRRRPRRLYYTAYVRCSGVTRHYDRTVATLTSATPLDTRRHHTRVTALSLHAMGLAVRPDDHWHWAVSKHTTHKVTTRESRRGASDRSFTVASSCPAQPPRPMHHRALRDPPASSLRGFSWAVDGQWLLAGFRGWAHARTTTPQPNQPLKTSEIKRSAWKSSCNVHTPRRWCAKTSGSVHLSRK